MASTAADMWGLGAVLLHLVCSGPVALGSAPPASGRPASLDALQDSLASRLVVLVHQASTSLSLLMAKCITTNEAPKQHVSNTAACVSDVRDCP